MVHIEDEIDIAWKTNYPSGYQRFLELYSPYNIFYLKFWYIKHIRRYGYVHIKLKGTEQTFEFVLQNKKNREGLTLVNGLEFETIYIAWRYYQDAIFENIIKNSE